MSTKHIYPHHEACVSNIPGDCGHGPVLWVNNWVLDDVCQAGHLLGQELFSPTRGSVGFGQQASWDEAIVWSHLTKNDVLCQNMIAKEAKKNLWVYYRTIWKYDSLILRYIHVILKGYTIYFFILFCYSIIFVSTEGKVSLTCRGLGILARMPGWLGPMCSWADQHSGNTSPLFPN